MRTSIFYSRVVLSFRGGQVEYIFIKTLLKGRPLKHVLCSANDVILEGNPFVIFNGNLFTIYVKRGRTFRLRPLTRA